MRIPILDLKPEMAQYGQQYLEAIQSVLDSTQFILGKEVAAFESEVADFLGVRHAIGCNSGTDALVIGLRALGIGPGDSVVVPSFTFFGSVEAISLVGATPVFVDIDPQTFNLDISSVESKLTKDVKAIIPVHLFGQSADMAEVMDLARRHNLLVLEDAAQAMGSDYNGKKVGSMGHIGAFSFFPSKNLGALGDGGLMVTNDDHLAQMCRQLRVHGSKKRYVHEQVGYNSRLDEIQAAVLRIKLRNLEEANEGRRQAAARYDGFFRECAEIEIPFQSPDSRHIYHQYTIRIRDGRRDSVHQHLSEVGIGSMIYYPIPVHRLSLYQHLGYRLAETERAAEEVLSLPIWPTISSETQLEVAKQVLAAV